MLNLRVTSGSIERSVIYKRKIKGPCIDPCGTHDLIVCNSDLTLPISYFINMI